MATELENSLDTFRLSIRATNKLEWCGNLLQLNPDWTQNSLLIHTLGWTWLLSNTTTLRIWEHLHVSLACCRLYITLFSSGHKKSFKSSCFKECIFVKINTRKCRILRTGIYYFYCGFLVLRNTQKNSYRDLTPDLRQKWWWKYMPLKSFLNPTSPFRVPS